jgi:hypothetical protein
MSQTRVPIPWRAVAALSALLAVVVALGFSVALFAAETPAWFADKDFANFWVAGRLVLSGQAMDLFGPQPAYFRHLTAVFGPDYPWRNWSYPPHMLLALWPLGFVSYRLAAVLFLAVTGAALAWSVAAFCGTRHRLVWIAILPVALVNAWALQNGFFTAALFIGALALRERRPVVAGLLLAALTVKPQLGLLFPFLLIAERRWTVIATTLVGTVALVALSALVLGWDAWRGYVAEVLPYQAEVMQRFKGVFVQMLASPFGYARVLGAPSSVAMVAHAVVALPVAVLALRHFFGPADAQSKAIVLAITTFLVTPYALAYDMGPVAAAAAALVLLRGRAGGWRDLAPPALVLAPTVMVPAAMAMLPVVQFALIAVLALALTVPVPPAPAAESG